MDYAASALLAVPAAGVVGAAVTVVGSWPDLCRLRRKT